MSPELDAKLSALLDGELPSEEAAALRAELARSPELAARLAALAAVDESLRALPSRPAPAHLGERVRAELRAQPARRVRRWVGRVALAAGVAAALLPLFWFVFVKEISRADREDARHITEDLPVIEVLDLLAELDELEERGSG